MSATELPESPTQLIAEVCTGTETIVQSVNVDEKISTLEQSAESLSSESVSANYSAGEYQVAQMKNEQRADVKMATADRTHDEDLSQAHISSAEKYIVEAERNGVLANSHSITAEETGAMAASLNQTATVTRAVQEEMTRSTFAFEEVENRTKAGVEKEIKEIVASAEGAGAAPRLGCGQGPRCASASLR